MYGRPAGKRGVDAALVAVAARRVVGVESVDFLATAQIPVMNDAAVVSPGAIPTRRGYPYNVNAVAAAVHESNAAARLDVPHTDGFVVTPRQDVVAIRVPRYRVDTGTGMTGQDAHRGRTVCGENAACSVRSR